MHNAGVKRFASEALSSGWRHDRFAKERQLKPPHREPWPSAEDLNNQAEAQTQKSAIDVLLEQSQLYGESPLAETCSTSGSASCEAKLCQPSLPVELSDCPASVIMSDKVLSMEDVAKHNTKEDCWVVLYGKAYDLTKFAKVHPGGAKLITDAAGMDATALFDPIHPKDIMDKLLKPSLTMGVVDAATIKPEHVVKAPEPHKPAPKKKKAASAEVEEEVEFKKPPLNAMLNSFDFESVAREVMEPQAWGYYSSGGDDEITLRDNHLAFQRITMRPRILVNVREIDMTTQILGVPASVPLYFTATALAKLAHQDGEVAIVKAAKKAGVPYMLPTLSSYTLDEMLEARSPDQQVFSQLYVNPERSRSEEYVKKLEDAGVKALFVTVDAPQLGRREKDMRNKFTQQGSDVQGDDEEDGAVDRSQGATRAISSYIDPGLNWEDVPWLKSITKMKVLLKGVQCAEDAVSAYKAGLAGCVLSNHGGRQLDTCRPGIEVLPEVMEGLKEAGATKENFAVFIDGGVRRGGDIFKAVALGAQAVGVGRPVLYSLASYGMNGIVRMVHMLQDELQMVMRLSGTPNIPSITEKHVIITNLADHIVPLPTDFLVQRTYQGLEPAAKL
ncbi:CYB2 [Symbiodinium necroappetens]|uniref:L-lactate dehydrogenase (cytochrome) n=1 Tax=Symbiodinium necroappetens TaxID=1628268 RepID=A0A813CHB6_9DINO|nr:CYB2 [Symbiodinium necroappetens]